MDLANKRVFVAGSTGLVGRAIVRRLAREDCMVLVSSRPAYDLRRQTDVEKLLSRERPEVVFCAAATVGGILANQTRPGEFGYDNAMIALNLIEVSRRVGVEKLVFLSSSCAYPRDCQQPMVERMMGSGALEPTNAPYAMAKLLGAELVRAYRDQYQCDFITVVPCNVYGEDDHYDGAGTHVMAALIARIVAAKREGARSVQIWGTGEPVREFIHADDAADALVFLAKRYSSHVPINVGHGIGISIRELARLIALHAGWEGEIVTNEAMPDGHPVKVMDVTRMSRLGWHPSIELSNGIRRTVLAYEATLP